ncbi:MAG TPA: MarR family transcriptional regulator [Rhabdochlamydiaceae bacterium]|jgi:DNA-binding MarR family transcriptional regulator
MHEKLNFKRISVYEGPKQSPGFLLWQVSTSWRSSIESVLKALGLTHPQFVVLATTGWLTRNNELITQVAIGKMAGLDPNTTSQIIKGLEQKSFIKRHQSSDGRAKNVSLTAQGAEILSQALPIVERADAEFFNPLTKNEGDCLVGLFLKIIPKRSVDTNE